MNRLAQILLLMLTFCLFLPQQVFSQDRVFDFERSYDDYIFNYKQYLQAHQQFLEDRNAYYKYDTLTAKTKATSSTLSMLQYRDEVVRTYLTAIKLRLSEATGISNYQQTVLYLGIDKETDWYFNHRENLTSAGTLEDLVKTGINAEERYPQATSLAFQALGIIQTGKAETIRTQLEEEAVIIEAKINEIRQEEEKDTAILERWFLEAENKIIRSHEKQTEAESIISQISPRKDFRIQNERYNRARGLLRESQQYTKEAVTYLSELIREVKSAD